METTPYMPCILEVGYGLMQASDKLTILGDLARRPDEPRGTTSTSENLITCVGVWYSTNVA